MNTRTTLLLRHHLAIYYIFRFTPKLLNGLHFNDHVAVHIVHNGPTMENAQVCVVIKLRKLKERFFKLKYIKEIIIKFSIGIPKNFFVPPN